MAQSASGPRILVMGCGGIGGTVAAHIAELGADVHVVSRNTATASAVQRNGFRLVGEGGRRTVPGRIYSEVPPGEFDLVLFATQPTDVEGAARQALPHLAPHGHAVILQNGLCESRVADLLGDPSRVIGGIVAWGATMPEPGVFDKTSSGGFVLGGMGGGEAAGLDLVEGLLASIGPIQRTDNLLGARWSKLALNCAVSTLGTLNGSTLGRVVRVRHARRLALEIITEVVAVAKAAGVRLEKVSGTLDLDWIALTDAEIESGSMALAAKHAMLLAVGLRYRRLRSSMLRAIEAGKSPAIDFLNGEVVRHGTRHEVPVPLNALVCDRVWAISRGEVEAGPALVARLYDETRARL
jgi:2-dehydropantoate 2-reductase